MLYVEISQVYTVRTLIRNKGKTASDYHNYRIHQDYINHAYIICGQSQAATGRQISIERLSKLLSDTHWLNCALLKLVRIALRFYQILKGIFHNNAYEITSTVLQVK